MTNIIWILAAFLAGSLPFSVWLGRLALGTEIRRYGDHNPGATNVGRAGGWQWGVLAAILDIFKGALPVALAWFWAGLDGWPLALVALAPVLGHAYSPFLGFRGGKAVAVTGGIWGGLTMGEAPLLMAILMLCWFLVLAVDGWIVILTMISFLVHLLLTGPDPTLLAVWTGNILILGWKHRANLAQPPGFRPWLKRMVQQ